MFLRFKKTLNEKFGGHMTLIFDPAEKGLAKVLRDYQIKALRFAWEKSDEGVISREVWQHTNKVLVGTISRASIINFLNAMVDEGVLNYREESGKGGYHRVYFPKLDEREFKKHIARKVITSLTRDFPEETNEVINQLK
jgi:hypothetical protein